MKNLTILLLIASFSVVMCGKENNPPEIQPTGTVTDIDGNTYNTIQIGDQEWMMENLKVTHYNNGDAIPNVTDNTTWGSLLSGAYCIYDNTANNADTYGNLYNWYAVSDSRGIAPSGWHVLTDDEWTELVNFLGEDAVAGGKLKEAGTAHWSSPNSGATNESGFTALPGGYRNNSDNYHYIGFYAYFWSSSDYNSNTAWSRMLDYNNDWISELDNTNAQVYRSRYNKNYGFSVRCVRDK